MRAPKVSVLIPAYQSAEYLGQAIQSVLEQSFQDFEIIISDNASTDNTEKVVAAFQDPRVHFYKNHETVEMGENWNRCLFLSKGEYVALLCSDDLWLPLFLEKTVEILDLYSDIGMCLTQYKFFYGDSDAEWERKILVKPGVYYDFAKIIIQKNPTPISGALVRHQCYEEVGAFKPFYSADYDIFLRISKTRWGMYYLALPLMKFRWHKTNLSNDIYKLADHAIQVLENHKFELDIEQVRERTLSEFYMRRGLSSFSSAVVSKKHAIKDIMKSFKLSKKNAIVALAIFLANEIFPRQILVWLKNSRSMIVQWATRTK